MGITGAILGAVHNIVIDCYFEGVNRVIEFRSNVTSCEIRNITTKNITTSFIEVQNKTIDKLVIDNVYCLASTFWETQGMDLICPSLFINNIHCRRFLNILADNLTIPKDLVFNNITCEGLDTTDLNGTTQIVASANAACIINGVDSLTSITFNNLSITGFNQGLYMLSA